MLVLARCVDDVGELLADNGDGIGQRLEGGAGDVIGTGRQGRRARVGGSEDPEVVLAVAPREGAVMAMLAIVPLRIPAPGHVPVFLGDLGVVIRGVHARSLDRLGQEGQGRRRLDHLPRGHDVVKDLSNLGLLAKHLERLHGGAGVGGRVLEKDVGGGGIAGAGGDVEVVAGGEGHAAGHEGVLLVGVVAGAVAVVAPVDAALALERVERAAAEAAGEDDFIRVLGPFDGIAANVRGPVDGREPEARVAGIEAGRRVVGPEPPDLEDVFAGDGVDGDNGAGGGVVDAHDERVEVGSGIIERALGGVDMACEVGAGSTRLAHGRPDAVADADGPGDEARGGADIVPKDVGCGGGDLDAGRLGNPRGGGRTSHGLGIGARVGEVGKIDGKVRRVLVGCAEVALVGEEVRLVLGLGQGERLVVFGDARRIGDVAGHGREVGGQGARIGLVAHRGVQPRKDPLKAHVAGDGVAEERAVEGMFRVELRVELGIGGQPGAGDVHDVLVGDHGDVLRGDGDGRLEGLGIGGSGWANVMAVPVEIVGPDEPVAAEVLGPLDVLNALLHPVDEAIVKPGRGPGGVEPGNGVARLDELEGEAGGGALDDLVGGEGGQGSALWRQEPLAQVTLDVERGGLLDDVHDLEPQGVARDAVGAEVAEDLDEDAALMVEGLHEALGLVVPQRAQLPEGAVGAALGGVGGAGAPVLVGDGPWEAAVIDDVDSPNARRGDGDGDAKGSELALGPVHGPSGLHGASGDGVVGGIEEEDAGAVGLEAGGAAGVGIALRQGGGGVGGGLAPGHADGAGLVGIDDAGMRAPVVGGGGVVVGRVGLGQPIVLLGDLQGRAGLVDGGDGDGAPEEDRGGEGRVGRSHPQAAKDQDGVCSLACDGKLHGRREVGGKDGGSGEGGIDRLAHPVVRGVATPEDHGRPELAGRGRGIGARLIDARGNASIGAGRGSGRTGDGKPGGTGDVDAGGSGARLDRKGDGGTRALGHHKGTGGRRGEAGAHAMQYAGTRDGGKEKVHGWKLGLETPIGRA